MKGWNKAVKCKCSAFVLNVWRMVEGRKGIRSIHLFNSWNSLGLYLWQIILFSALACLGVLRMRQIIQWRSSCVIEKDTAEDLVNDLEQSCLPPLQKACWSPVPTVLFCSHEWATLPWKELSYQQFLYNAWWAALKWFLTIEQQLVQIHREQEVRNHFNLAESSLSIKNTLMVHEL